MTTPNISSIISSLGRSLQNISLNHHHSSNTTNGGGGGGDDGGGGGGATTGTYGGGGGGGFQENEHDSSNTSQTTCELTSHISLPHHWEQILDLEAGEVYYINWLTGKRVKEDPRTSEFNADLEDSEYEYDSSSCDSDEGSSFEEELLLPSFSRNQSINKISCNNYDYNNNNNQSNERGNVLVVGGCKICMMYFMVPKQVEDCPKCSGQLLHFDKSENSSSP